MALPVFDITGGKLLAAPSQFLSIKLAETTTNTSVLLSIDMLIDKAVCMLSYLDSIYIEVDLPKKREIVGLVTMS